MPVAELIEEELETKDPVLIVEDDPEDTGYYEDEFAGANVDILKAEDELQALAQLSEQREAGFHRMVVILDLMLQSQNPSDGLDLMRKISDLPEYQEGKLKVVVRTASAEWAKREARAYGASAVHSKVVDPKETFQDVLLFLGREVRTHTLLFEVVSVDQDSNEIEIRYATDVGEMVRAIFDLDFAPEDARVAGGSFYCDFYKKLEHGRKSMRSIARSVDKEEERLLLEELFDGGQD